MSTAKQEAIRIKRSYLSRLVGQAYREGATAEAIDAYLLLQGIKDPAAIRSSVESRKTLPFLGEQELKNLGGQDTFRALFAIAPEVAPMVEPRQAAEPMSLAGAHLIVRHWLGNKYDLSAFDAMLSTVAALRLDTADPLWMMFVTGSGFTKTETVIAAEGAGAIITSTIASEGALLSASSKKEREKNCTGGLLRRLGSRGVLVIKDFTTILSMSREVRGMVIAAFREIHDGKWERNVGVSGGNSPLWVGRIAVIAACTTAWDAAREVVSSMGDRFVIFRLDSTTGRLEAGRQSMANIGHEGEMRAALKDAVAGVIAGMDPSPIVLTAEEVEQILHAANLTTRCRTAVETDFRGEVTDAHAPEAPTRFAKELAQIVRGACAIGMERTKAMSLAIRCARDSMPPMRLAILKAIQTLGRASPSEVREAINKPWHTVKRQLDALHLLGVLSEEVEEPDIPEEGQPAAGKRTWFYELASGVDPAVLFPSPDLSPTLGKGDEERESDVTASVDKHGDRKVLADAQIPF